ncbi:MAG: hypothetical protein QW500_00705 [Candidatus Micrarchaeia archaeon]
MSISKSNPVELYGKNSEVISTIYNNRASEEFIIRRKVSKKILYLLLEATRVKKIIISKNIARTLPKKSLSALEKTGVQVCILDYVKKGRRKKYDVEHIIGLLNRKKIPLKDISRDEKIPLRTLYYYKKNFSERARN